MVMIMTIMMIIIICDYDVDDYNEDDDSDDDDDDDDDDGDDDDEDDDDDDDVDDDDDDEDDAFYLAFSENGTLTYDLLTGQVSFNALFSGFQDNREGQLPHGPADVPVWQAKVFATNGKL